MEKEKIKKFFSDDGFINQLLSKETPEEVQEILEKKDIELSIEEIVNLREILMGQPKIAGKTGCSNERRNY